MFENSKINIKHSLFVAFLQRRYSNRPLVEFEIAAQEQMKITELRLHKLFSVGVDTATANTQFSTAGAMTKSEGNYFFKLAFTITYEHP